MKEGFGFCLLSFHTDIQIPYKDDSHQGGKSYTITKKIYMIHTIHPTNYAKVFVGVSTNKEFLLSTLTFLNQSPQELRKVTNIAVNTGTFQSGHISIPLLIGTGRNIPPFDNVLDKAVRF